MRKLVLLILFLFLFLSDAFASYDPLSRPNNPFGIHILFIDEVQKAASIVNANGGDWGYVTIPIQYSDRNIEKWQTFMDDARKYHVTPIVRLATDPFHSNTSVWRKPTYSDILDFANFLNSLSWPTKNRYVLLFNEVNRSDEWGGEAPNPSEYADLVFYAGIVFKEKNTDFFLITAGLDNAAPNDGVKFLNNFTYIREMLASNPEALREIDGIASHSYPNPGFSQAPVLNRLTGTSTFRYERDLITELTGTEKAAFITETGWSVSALPETTIADYFKTAVNLVWGKDSKIVALTPFLLNSGAPPFDKFSFLKENSLTLYGKEYKDFPKIKGDPLLEIVKKTQVEGVKIISRRFNEVASLSHIPASNLLKNYFKAILRLER